MADPGADRRHQRQQAPIEMLDGRPVGPPGAPAVGMDGLDRRLEAEAAGPPVRPGAAQPVPGLREKRRVPQGRVLLRQRHEGTGQPVAAGRAPGFRKKKQRQQRIGLGMGRRAIGDDPGKPAGLLGEVAARVLAGEGIVPAERIGGVDRPEDGVDPLGQCLGPGISKPMARSRIRALARTRPWPRVAGFTRKAEAIRRTSMPRITWRIRGVRMPGSMAGWAQASISASRSSGKVRPAGRTVLRRAA